MNVLKCIFHQHLQEEERMQRDCIPENQQITLSSIANQIHIGLQDRTSLSLSAGLISVGTYGCNLNHFFFPFKLQKSAKSWYI